nr:MAG TPA: hypothetical protein [Caudoviricetes sp.]
MGRARPGYPCPQWWGDIGPVRSGHRERRLASR